MTQMKYSSKPAELKIVQERITSQVGRGKFSTLATPVTDTATANRKVRRADSLVLALNPAITDTAAQLSYLTALTNRQKDTCEAYWYHTDHLGSSSWITDSAGNPVQHLHYLPWGEDFVNRRSTTWNAMYTFSAKEKDTETGYSYFGSRYYSSNLSIWLSVDPMSDKYLSMSPYVYCANNPVKLVDPNGKAWKPTINEYTGECTGYEWIKPEDSYESDGKTLKEGLYKEAIFFSDNGTYNPKNRKNIGSSTATVYKADGSKKIFQACTNPSDASKYATVPGGTYIARMGMHVGHNTRYMALKLQGKIELGMENPAYNDHRTYATGIDIHMPGEDNLTGMTRSGSAISEGCLLIDGFEWNNFMDCFSPETDISVTVSRTMSAPTNMNVNNILPSILLPQYPLCPPDKTRTNTVCPIF